MNIYLLTILLTHQTNLVHLCINKLSRSKPTVFIFQLAAGSTLGGTFSPAPGELYDNQICSLPQNVREVCTLLYDGTILLSL